MLKKIIDAVLNATARKPVIIYTKKSYKIALLPFAMTTNNENVLKSMLFLYRK